EIRYRFGPLERRGWVGSLRPGQLVIISSAVFFTILLVQALKNGLGLLGGVILLSLGALLTFVPLHGRPLNEWVPLIGVFMARKATGRSRFRSRAPEAGTRFAGGDEPVSLPDSIGKVELLAFPFRGVELGVLADRPNHTFSAVIQARARSFVLLDPVDKAHRLAGWAGVIAGLAREGSPISRVQWMERTAPDDPDALSRYLREAIDPSIGLDALPLPGSPPLPPAAPRLPPPTRLSYHPHARPTLARLDSVDPDRSGGVAPRNAWPMRAEEHWSYYRTNDVVHATYWIAVWSRIDVGPDFLAPLLVQTRSMRTVAVTMEPVPPLKAMRAVGFAKTADAPDDELRQKLGFLGTAKRRNQADAVNRREQELADGHADVRFSGYITVTADNPEALAEACGEVEHAAGQSRLELQRCDGEQELCFSYTLPMGRGLKGGSSRDGQPTGSPRPTFRPPTRSSPRAAWGAT